ncbi:uncharacterized protein LOC115630093 isoform X3 [Scaptodrosophila lebanonensis]|uniref:Uncharacterized protein LOC115630093 isoform X3 n=1 Tax=Drosophila lebanonensis TaxID=7225 RepID=A0A6J2U1P4_DROLE|nr:uncharacterized protein LOC115630093 isoform X3 [Scaptodrosophila lebanonensis]
MNLMFRKNFREGANKSGGGGGKLQSKANRTKRSRDIGLMQQQEEIHYRTHLFFSPNRSGYEVGEERCSAFSGIPSSAVSTTTSFALPSKPYEVDAPQPLVDRTPPVSVLRWKTAGTTNTITQTKLYKVEQQEQQQNYKQSHIGTPTDSPSMTNDTTAVVMPTAARQVKFGFGDKMDTTTSEPISMAMLNRDCLIIPIHSIDRFLPAGLPVPAFSTNGNCNSPLNVLEIADPKLCLLVHLMSPLEAIDPLIESPLSYPLAKQRSIASELLTEVQQANTAVGGMLLANMEKASEFPFISYYLINTIQTDPSTFYAGLRLSSLSKFEPKVLK